MNLFYSVWRKFDRPWIETEIIFYTKISLWSVFLMESHWQFLIDIICNTEKVRKTISQNRFHVLTMNINFTWVWLETLKDNNYIFQSLDNMVWEEPLLRILNLNNVWKIFWRSEFKVHFQYQLPKNNFSFCFLHFFMSFLTLECFLMWTNNNKK